MTVFKGYDAIREFLEELDRWLSDSVDVYLLGGSAMTVHGLKDQTEDIDLALGVVTEFEHVYQTLIEEGFTVIAEPTKSFEEVGTTVELAHQQRGFRIDLFEQQVVGKVWLTDQMRRRAEQFWTGNHVTAFTLSDEDMFLLKAVSGGDIASGRQRDLEDMRIYAQRGINYETVLHEIDAQRPFNTGATEAQQIRDRSHPLFAVEMAVSSLSGLPDSFADQIERLATEFQIEYTVLVKIDDGLNDIEAIREQVSSNVRALGSGSTDAINDAINRLCKKQILTRDGGVVRLA
jgi:alkanesulfonate monooxygenase SsuD/methylene tetrahydromethanopterin reductase-like flavin-dependent oxidoreductase (luciferase family)